MLRQFKRWYFFLFHHSSVSFEEIHQYERTLDGTYSIPYSAFKKLQRKIRITSSVTTVFFILSVGISIIYGPYGPRETAIASQVSWDGGGDGLSWSNANNWSNDQLPGSTDDVIIDTTVTVDIAVPTTINSLILGPNNNPTLNFSYDAITNGALTIVSGNFSMNTGSTITHTVGNTVVVGSVYIDVQNGSATIAGNINLAGSGFTGGSVGVNGNGGGGGIHEDVGNGGGGGHGGAGGTGNSVGSTGGISYGSLTAPITLGSGGAGGTGLLTFGGAGGGAVRLNAKASISLSGNIRAWGNQGIDVAGPGRKCGGGGAGGSIFISTQGTLSGAGALSVLGGAGGNCNLLNGSGGGGGGGGRIRLEYVSDSFSGSKIILGGSGGTGYEGNNGQSGSNGSLSTKQYSVPITPSITSPANGSTVSSFTPTLTSSSYSGDISHTTTDWEIDDSEDFGSVVWSSYVDSVNKESIIINTTLSPNTLYYVRVRHANNAGNSSYSSSVAFWTLAVTPEAPILGSPTLTTMDLTILPGLNSAGTTYALYETVSGVYVGNIGLLQTDPLWKTFAQWGGLVTIRGLTARAHYTFCVKAKNSMGVETTCSPSTTSSTLGRSQASIDTLAPSLPQNITVEKIPESGVRITWEDPSEEDFVAIFLLRGVDPIPPSGNPYSIIPRGKGEYIDNDIVSGKTYQYQLRSRDFVGNLSVLSEIFSITISDTSEEEPPVPTDGDKEEALLPITDFHVIERYKDGLMVGFTSPYTTLLNIFSLDLRYITKDVMSDELFEGADHYTFPNVKILESPNTTLRLFGFLSDTYLSLGIKIVSDDGRISPLSNILTTSTLDIIPPGPLEDPQIIHRARKQ